MSGRSIRVERSEVHATAPDRVEDLVRRMYVDYRPKTTEGTGEFTFAMRRTAAEALTLDHVNHAMATSAVSDPFQRLTFFFPASGSLAVRRGNLEARVRPGDTLMFPVGVPLEIDWTPLHTEILSVPVEVAERAAAERGLTRPRFVGTTPVSAAADRLWRATVGFVADQLESPASPLSEPAAYTGALDLIGAAALSTFPNTTMTQDYLPEPGQAAPAALRRAVEHIDANAALPLTFTDIASAASVSPPELQRAFQLRYGYGAMEYLRRVRLERAHLELRLADPASGLNVPAVAARWGFLSPAGFSRAYREAYGDAPEQTLRS